MSYKALYRIYRPQTFDEVVGQKHIVQTLKNAIREDKIAHAYLFAGPKGTGKTTIAKLLAKAVNCTSEDKPCGECESCKSIAAGMHPDIIEIDAASNNKIDEAREIIEKVKFSPIQGKYKVYIIDEVHMMTTGAFNTLLKTLEEPPAHVIFILATTEPHKVLPTIVSRCQRFDFNKISANDLEKRIKDILDNEQISYEEEAVKLIAELADGGARDAISILDQTIAYAGNDLKAQHVRDIYGVVSTKEAVDFLVAVSGKQADVALEKINDFTRRGLDLNRFANTLINILKEAIIFNNSLKYEGIIETSQLEKLSKYIQTSVAFKYVDVLMETLNNFYKVSIPKTYFELAVLKMCNTEATSQVSVAFKEKTIESKEVVKEVSKVVAPSKPEIKEEIKTPVEEKKIEIVEEPKQVDEEQEPLHIEMPEDKTDGETIFNENNIMNLLVQATKEDLLDILNRWKALKQYATNPKYVKAVNLLIDGKPLAAAHSGVVVGYMDEPQLKNVNKKSSYYLVKEFLKELLGRDVVFFAIQDKRFSGYRNKFIALKGSQSLPTPHEICDPEFLVNEIEAPQQEKPIDEKSEIDEAKEYGTSLFGDLFKSEV